MYGMIQNEEIVQPNKMQMRKFSFCYFTYSIFNWLVDSFFVFVDCYDPLDPNRNITITFQTYKWIDHANVISVLAHTQ